MLLRIIQQKKKKNYKKEKNISKTFLKQRVRMFIRYGCVLSVRCLTETYVTCGQTVGFASLRGFALSFRLLQKK